MSAIEMKEELLMDTAAYMENNLTLLGKLKNHDEKQRNDRYFVLNFYEV